MQNQILFIDLKASSHSKAKKKQGKISVEWLIKHQPNIGNLLIWVLIQ